MGVNQLSLLKTRRFLPLFVTQFLGAFNDNVFKNAIVILITYRIADAAKLNAQILVTLSAAIFILPFFLFSATAGQVADKFEKSRLIRVIKFAEILLMMLASVGFFTQNVMLLMTALLLIGLQATFFGPIKYAILPDHLHENELIAGNGLIEAGTFLAILLGTILGGVLVLHRVGDYLISITIIIIACAGFLSSFYIPKTLHPNSKLVVHRNFIKDTWHVIQYSKEQESIFIAIIGISWFWLVGATYLAEFPVFTKDDLHASEGVVTLFFSLFSIGIAIGSLLCNQLMNGKLNLVYVPIGALGITLFSVDVYFAASHASQSVHSVLISLTAFLQIPNGWRIILDLLLIAVCSGLYTVPLYTLLQQRSHPAHRARVIASNNIINSLFMVAGAVITIVMLKMGMAVREVLLVVAIANLGVAIYLCKLLPKRRS